ncbi:hypothetical protein PRZ48_001778 [Zasmidium cellare]|uniref:Uncharacterized protein n=1 Tax=Zasmidium cellare TaxID=395010 RepID=A0ABR0F402_ZASCE|nr:hypothetical protein PRZ48_001778 [Zasmidium cellare]
MASTSTSAGSKRNEGSEKTSKNLQEKKSQEEKNAAKRRHDYVPTNLQPQGRLLRIHTEEDITHSMPGRIVKEWTKCEKPTSEPNRGCRTGRMGFWVEVDGEYKAVLICKRKVCDWLHADGEVGDEEHEMEGEQDEDDSHA